MAAAQYPQAAIAAGPGGGVLRGIAIVVIPAILDPFGGVAGGVVKAEAVRPKRACGNSLLLGRTAAGIALRMARADGAPPPERQFGSCARRIFPFSLAGQPVFLP